MRRLRCPHRNVRCIHGDEINQRTKVYLRWWKEPMIPRAACLDCGRALDRGLPDVCTWTRRPHG